MKTLSPDAQRNLTLLCVICTLASLVFVGITSWGSLGQGREIEKNTQNVQTAKEQVKVARKKVVGSDSTLAKTVRRLGRTQRKQDRAIRKLNALIRDLRAAGAKLPSVVKETRGPAGLPGATGRPGASATPFQIRAAVARYCEDNPCGTPPTQAQIDAAVRACFASGGCRAAQGPRGETGRPGRDGEDGTNGVSPPPPPTLPCRQADPALDYQCVPETDTPPPPPPPTLLP